MMAESTTFFDCSLTSGDISAPILPKAISACPGSVKIAPIRSAGFPRSSSAITTSAVRITPFSSSTGVSGAKVATFTSLIETGAIDGDSTDCGETEFVTGFGD